jgi:hypothetical protein
MTTNPLYSLENILVNPIVYEINEPVVIGGEDIIIRPRTEKGWTLDYVFNKDMISWFDGNVFYYWGISGETDPAYYVDNNLSFSFNVNGEIEWKANRYSSYCDETPVPKKTSGKTPVLCTGGTSADFNITIVFEREFEFDDCCDLSNEGGTNDLITGQTITNMMDVLTGATPIYITNEELTKKWTKERYNRLGTLKIYLNGRPIYKLKGWEEVIPSTRQSVNPIVQVIGGGTTGSGEIHDGICIFDILKFTYYEEPFNYTSVRDNYISLSKIYNINECASGCDEAPLP